MSEIFYSQVDENLQKELNARGRSGKFSRTTQDMQFMLEKIANVTLIPYKDADRKIQLVEAILGGNTVRSGEYLPSGPSGFLSDRKYNYAASIFENGEIVQKTKETRTNTSRRIPPFITSLDISIGDHSMGLLNNATINITIPNPERDLNFIESVYFRPGRHVTVEIQHPASAVLTLSETNGELTGSLPSAETLKSLYPNFAEQDIRSFKKLNAVRFDGLIKSFDLDYQPDMSVNATISMVGTSNVYTDLSLIIDSTEKVTDAEKQAAINQSNSEQIITDILPSFYSNFLAEVDSEIQRKEKSTGTLTSGQLGISDEFISNSSIQTNNRYWIKSATLATTQTQKYVTIVWLVDYINRIIIKKSKSNTPTATIVFTEKNNLCVSNYYGDSLVSADPHRILLQGFPSDRYGTNNPWLKFQPDSVASFVSSDNPEQPVCRPQCVYINMEVIQEIVANLEKTKTFTVSALLDAVSKEVYFATGHAIDLKLITHPEDLNFLLWYDANRIKFSGKPVNPYSVPMFSNNKNGTIVRDFKFSGKLPEDASNLAYVTNQDPSEIAESDIAPFVAYMYAANTVERTGPNEAVGTLITAEELKKINDNYRAAHEKYYKQFQDSKTAFGLDPTNTEKRAALSQALQKFVQYPFPTIIDTNNIAVPVIPFTVEFTIDGVNGFRYGDVLTFDGLPDRYKKNVVFSIASLTHTVGTDGQWTTSVRCITRPKIES
jgi:hypothetical protein